MLRKRKLGSSSSSFTERLVGKCGNVSLAATTRKCPRRDFNPKREKQMCLHGSIETIRNEKLSEGKKEMKSPTFDTNQLCASAASFGSNNARFLTNVFFFYCLVNRYTIRRRRTPASIQSVVICWPPKSPRSKITASPPSECPVPLRLW